MKQAQAAWAALSGLFVICATVVIVGTDAEEAFAVTCLVIGALGWCILTAMILWDRRP